MFDLKEFIEKCKTALNDESPALSIESLVKEAIANPDAVREAFSNAENVDHRGPITFACRNVNITVADVTTPPGLKSPAHNHNMWAVIGVYEGQELNRFYQNENGVLEEKGERLLTEGDIAVLGKEAIHAIANPLSTVSSALHVYGGDLVEQPDRSMWNPHTNKREDYDISKILDYIAEMSTM